ncbi:uncharacterized protein LOC130916697 isoform X2 [Corythoichthys intestinalis]|uniref:uncharacterized protein LOC130916697 isoform X2 n=1 Tax=Corythoichthys intestinalis TaxID=161448 RepID=UPI0025A546CA|nr:uncharacterized protein LOC130916697 isoform X2 [Corythoichthys intestinalis]
MVDSDIRLEALSALCNTPVTSCQAQVLGHGPCLASALPMSVMGFVSAAMGRSGDDGEGLVIDEDEFFDRRYDFDFSKLKDKCTYYRGGEVYHRPCGWLRFALKVWDKYPDGNVWLGERGHCTTTYSKLGEWPVSYHGTSKNGARAIIVTNYQPGPGQKYGRGVYSTPYLEDAVDYTKTFQSKATGKKYRVVMQNRMNPAYREKHNGDKYWLLPIPEGLTQDQEQDLVEKAIRPCAVLIKPL